MNTEMQGADIQLAEIGPGTDTFREEILAGLRRDPRTIPSKFFYDARGSELFEQICSLVEYYPMRTESSIMDRYAGEMVERLGPRCLLVEYGSGSSLKTRSLLDRMIDPAGYVPVDISKEHLSESAGRLAEDYPDLEILPVFADYVHPIDLPRPTADVARVAVYFPGSTIGNFHPPEARDFLRRAAALCGAGGALLIGVDLQKDRRVLEAAYNDAAGVTAEFNMNVLHRINRDLNGRFNVDAFEHEAVYNERDGCIEMYLVSTTDQEAQVGGQRFRISKGERICTEYSYKYTIDGFGRLARSAGWSVDDVWIDERGYFSVQYLVAGADASETQT